MSVYAAILTGSPLNTHTHTHTHTYKSQYHRPPTSIWKLILWIPKICLWPNFILCTIYSRSIENSLLCLKRNLTTKMLIKKRHNEHPSPWTRPSICLEGVSEPWALATLFPGSRLRLSIRQTCCNQSQPGMQFWRHGWQLNTENGYWPFGQDSWKGLGLHPAQACGGEDIPYIFF